MQITSTRRLASVADVIIPTMIRRQRLRRRLSNLATFAAFIATIVIVGRLVG